MAQLFETRAFEKDFFLSGWRAPLKSKQSSKAKLPWLCLALRAWMLWVFVMTSKYRITNPHFSICRSVRRAWLLLCHGGERMRQGCPDWRRELGGGVENSRRRVPDHGPKSHFLQCRPGRWDRCWRCRSTAHRHHHCLLSGQQDERAKTVCVKKVIKLSFQLFKKTDFFSSNSSYK